MKRKHKPDLPVDAVERLIAAGWQEDQKTHPWVSAWRWQGPSNMPGRYRLEDAWSLYLWMRKGKG